MFNISTNLHLVPPTNKKNPDMFFALLEHVTESGEWSDSNRVLMLRFVLSGKAQEVFCSSAADPNLQYATVKDVVLKTYVSAGGNSAML